METFLPLEIFLDPSGPGDSLENGDFLKMETFSNLHPMTHCVLRARRENGDLFTRTGQLGNLTRLTRTLKLETFQIFSLARSGYDSIDVLDTYNRKFLITENGDFSR